MVELVVYKVRPKNGDKRLRVFRILMDIDDSDSGSFKIQHESVLDFFNRIFPYGFYLSLYERHVIDYSVIKDSGITVCDFHVFEHFNHDYLAQYLTSSDDL